MARTLREILAAVSHQAAGQEDQACELLLAEAAAHGLAVDQTLLAEAIDRALEQGVGLDELQTADLYLAAACGRGQVEALRRFDALLGPELDRAIAKSPSLGLTAAEFRQLVYDRLFVHEPDASPRIDTYVGRGSLKAWLRVMASRLVIDLSRRRDRVDRPSDDLSEKLRADQNTELDYLRHVYGPALSAAFEQALSSLSVRQRNLLRQRYLHELSADALAKMYGVHRSTMFDWLDKARATLLQQVRSRLATAVPGDQLESVIGMLGSQLQLSVRRLLESKLEPDAHPGSVGGAGSNTKG